MIVIVMLILLKHQKYILYYHLQILPETVIEEVSVNIGSDNDNPATATYQSRYKVLLMLCDAFNTPIQLNFSSTKIDTVCV